MLKSIVLRSLLFLKCSERLFCFFDIHHKYTFENSLRGLAVKTLH